MSARSTALVLGLVVAAGGGAFALVYGPRDGALMALFMLGCGALVLGGAHLLARRRRVVGALSRQFVAGISLAIGLVTLGVGAIALLMFLSPHDAFTMIVLLLFAGALSACSASLLAGGVLDDIESVRDGLAAVGEGRREIEITTTAHDELAELAAAANEMAGRLDAEEHARRELVAAVSHDLRTPITSLRLLAAALQDDLVEGPAERGRYLADMETHIAALSNLIDDLFELSRL
ncbi:MAG: hypothetical protein H0V85_05805, partial [Thermoleophilaceae bacterium]|nr:hypothetical protein [Thermoleophilaceae bacterium]